MERDLDKLPRYYFIFDANNDFADPIDASLAHHTREQQKKEPDKIKENSRDLGYDLDDEEILVAFKWKDLEKFGLTKLLGK